MISLLISHVVISVVVAVMTYVSAGLPQALSLLGGAGLAFVNLAALVYTWPSLLKKKRVALSIGIIVIKFAILGWILYEVVRAQSVHMIWFAGGLALTGISVVITSFISSTEDSSDTDSSGRQEKVQTRG